MILERLTGAVQENRWMELHFCAARHVVNILSLGAPVFGLLLSSRLPLLIDFFLRQPSCSAPSTAVLTRRAVNDTCIATLGKAYGWNLNEQRQRRLRCLGHIINLVAQAFILGEKK